MRCRCLPDPSGVTTTVDHVRLFRNDPLHRWRYRVHEQILASIREAGGEARFSNVVIDHTGYMDPVVRLKKLKDRDLPLLLLAYEEQPYDPFTLFNLGQCYRSLNDPARALGYLQDSLNWSCPSDSIVRKLYYLIADCQQQLGNANEAILTCQRGLAICPNDEELLFLEARLRTAQGDYHGAKAVLVRLLGTQSGADFASVPDGLRGFRGRHQLALVCFRSGEYREAESQWRTALKEQPGFLAAHVELGELFLAQKRFSEARQQAETIASLPNGALESVRLLGKVHIDQEQFTEARAVLEQANQRFGACVPLLSLLSYALLRENRDLDRARAVLLDILRLEPNNASAKQNLDVLQRSLGPGGSAR
jgi:tetratricopeptide (TPR) repeat protein